MQTQKVVVSRTTLEETGFDEIKDPSVIAMPDGSYLMYASVGTSTTQSWMIGRFAAQSPQGPWNELPPVTMNNVEGREVCAPAVVYDAQEKLFKMYVQTTCFQEGGVIALAISKDGRHFEGVEPHPAVVADIVNPKIPVVGLYDVAISEISDGGVAKECMIYSAYRRVGCGDVYMSLRPANDPQAKWDAPRLVLAQEDVPFHNRPDDPEFEWGIEGAKLVEVGENAYVMIAVCFRPDSRDNIGTRQRVFLAGATSPEGPFKPMTMPIAPTAYPEGLGENGHPDTIDLGATLGILYQERAGDRKPWHLRYTTMQKSDLAAMVHDAFAKGAAAPKAPARKP